MRNLLNHRRIEHRNMRHGFGESTNRGRSQSQNQKEYYWIWFDKDDSHKGLWGSYRTYEEAERKAVSKLNVPYEVVKLKTVDADRARQILMGKQLDETGDINKTFNRYSHTGSED